MSPHVDLQEGLQCCSDQDPASAPQESYVPSSRGPVKKEKDPSQAAAMAALDEERGACCLIRPPLVVIDCC